MRNGIFLLLIIWSLASNAVTLQAQIHGTTQTVTIEIGPTTKQMLTQFEKWEATLLSKGVQAHFFLAAGDLRRAVLGVSSEGPGDVEVLVHIESHDVFPLYLSRVLDFLKENGVEVKEDLARIFGAKKKVDIFVKDRFALNNQKPYNGELGNFDGMGDTSLNQLRYSPSLNQIDGESSNLAKLAQHQIAFTEKSKAEKRAEAASIPHTGYKSLYPETILRLALRSLRLETEILLSPNPNALELDSSFDVVRRGFEHYFDQVPSEAIARFELNETYIEQFLKIFRGRTLKERRAIAEYLKTYHAPTCKIWKALGLNFELLVTKPRDAKQEARREIEATIQNARYDQLRPFLDARLNGRNPFQDPSLQPELFALAKSRTTVPTRMIPIPILDAYSVELAYWVEHFDDLTLEEKRKAIDGYIEALKFFNGATSARLSEKKFHDRYFRKFAFLDINQGLASERPLLDFIESSWPKESAKFRWAHTDRMQTGSYIRDIKARIRAASRKGQSAAVVVDLDGVVFLGGSRAIRNLKKFDTLNGTDFFSSLMEEETEVHSTRDLILFKLKSKIKDHQTLSAFVTTVSDHFWSNVWNQELLETEAVNMDLVRTLQEFETLGAKIIFLTARKPFVESGTKAALARAGMGGRDIIFNGDTLAPNRFKAEYIKSLVSQGWAIAGFLDDDRLNVEAVREANSQVEAYQVLIRKRGDERQTLLFQSEKPNFEALRVIPHNQRTCRELFMKVKK